MRLAFITPPLIKPSEPGLSAAAAARWFAGRGVDAFSVDASIGWHGHALSRGNLEAALALAEAQGYAQGSLQAFRLAMRDATAPVPPLKRPQTYADRRVYSSAASHLGHALRLASVPHPGVHLRVGDVAWAGRRPHVSGDLEDVASMPGPFDAYFEEVLIPRLEAEGVSHVAVSLTFLHQAFAAFRLAHLLEQRLPGVQRLLGGALVACWTAVGSRFDAPVFRRFHRVFPTSSEAEMEALAAELGGRPAPDARLLAPDLADMDWGAYLGPQPTVPVALGRGCYWRRCTFCPDHLHPHHEASRKAELAAWLEAVAERFPGGAMLHLTDSALSPVVLGHVADVIRSRRLPLRWHGFVRLEARFADPGLAERLAEGGCALLQWGLETASPRLLTLMDKGVTAAQARTVLRTCAGAGIKNHAYLLFGLPTETEADRELTLAFVQEEAAHLHDLNPSILNLPRRSPMHEAPERFGITELSPFGHGTDLSLYDDFRCAGSHPRLEARHWLAARFFKDPAVKGILGDLHGPFKANHACFLPTRTSQG